MPRQEGLIVQNMGSAVRGPFSVSFDLGSCAVLQGPSGVGKSLFLRMIADLDPNTGTVTLDGTDRTAMPAPMWRRLVTYVAAESGWWAETVAEHMRDVAAARALMPDLGLDPDLLDAPVARLSTGERQRSALVRAVVGRPRFLLLDEPTSALDAASRDRVETMLGGLKSTGLGFVIVSHDSKQAERLGDRHFVMAQDNLTEILS
ncbi:ABC transporter ATP-binding protein [Lichenifustis flavocetrariae]|uniref:ABC transporter ATP-binding protein n=1 Tax=Lichenifustis flavocetrariae TaxID=2949735 RepID=A0AA41Z7V4_9HYPH|nr:ABC transporter ATP-binding protein [Lichenifustis flavocetrariae]MCW6512113.1 ABC transporter ATP-binding protein [Lichenifustis flavocetrariae]